MHDWQIEATAIALDSAVSSADYHDALTSIDNPFDGYMVFQVRVYFSKEGLCLLKAVVDAAPWNLRTLCNVNTGDKRLRNVVKSLVSNAS